MTDNFDPVLKTGITLASFIKSGKVPSLKEGLTTSTNWGTMIGAAIFKNFIGISEGPDDLFSLSDNNIIITSELLVGLKKKLVTTLLLRNDNIEVKIFDENTLKMTICIPKFFYEK